MVATVAIVVTAPVGVHVHYRGRLVVVVAWRRGVIHRARLLYIHRRWLVVGSASWLVVGVAVIVIRGAGVDIAVAAVVVIATVVRSVAGAD